MKRWKWSHSIHHKTILGMVLVGLLPLLLSLVLTYIEERRALRETSGSNFKGIAVEVARKIETQITRGINEAQQLATIPFIRTSVIEANRSYEGREPEKIKAFIEEWQQRWRQRQDPDEFPVFVNHIAINYLMDWNAIRKSDYLGILVTDNQGAIVLSSLPQVQFYHGESAWWRAAFREGAGQIYVSDLTFDPSFGTHVLNVAVPIFDEQRKQAIGTVSILLRRDSLFRSISEVTAGSTGHAMLMASDGTPLICPVLSLEQHVIQPSLVAAIEEKVVGWVQAEADSHGAQDSIVGFARLRIGEPLAPESFGGRHWVTYVRQDPQETFAPLDQMLIKVATYGIIVFGILWLMGIMVARRIVSPIQTLHDGVQRIGSGNLDHHLILSTGDEIEDLANGFNKMATNLKQSFAQLNDQMNEIRQLEERYRDLIEKSPEMIHQIDKTGRFVHVNETELEKLGYSLAEMLEKYLWDIVPVSQQSEIRTYFQHLPHQQEGTLETVFVTRQGTCLDVEIHSTALVDSVSGELVYTRAFVRDITERKALQRQVEQYTTKLEEEVAAQTHQLSQSEQRYRALFNRSADSIFMVDSRGIIVAANEREQEVLGYEESALRGHPFTDFVAEKYQELTDQLLTMVVSGEEKVPTKEIEVYASDRRLLPVEMDLIRVEQESAVLAMVQLRDITERKQLEARLQQHSEELEEKVQERTLEIHQTKLYLESLLENANDVIYTLDHDQRFTYVNSKVEIWGYGKEDLLGRPFLTLLSKRHRGRHLKDILNMHVKQEYEVEVMSRKGETRSVLVSVSPLRNDLDSVVGVLGIARDITDRKSMEQHIRNTERLASVGKLAAGVAHEINNPLGGILNCLYNIRKGTLAPGRQEEYLMYMEDGLRRAQKIVRQLLDFSQQREPEFTMSEINVLIDRVLVLINHAIVEKGLQLEIDLAADLPAMFVDPHMIEQVITNLLLNAVQATQSGGRIVLRTRIVGEMCEIEVSDTGTGIPADVRPHIFDPFFTTKRTGEGTGLGLSVSLGIVERHGGQLEVESEEGRGTVFTVRLPCSATRVPTGRVS
ncbi:PAS domain S-box protein [Candidatus Nitronereus thalassa]|uniref:histidine kinase n=1 Tax=Candidatus Nitronereus thalassa TaxID=3020898 RepID=A0ABU3KCL3_9BACT|nr:PAS domain S-box protein [Candidatus Nitronereus thalassa]MDT7044160.1 PAS domain S-box protein [Candidatus Nitronereus thalassa]